MLKRDFLPLVRASLPVIAVIPKIIVAHSETAKLMGELVGLGLNESEELKPSLRAKRGNPMTLLAIMMGTPREPIASVVPPSQ